MKIISAICVIALILGSCQNHTYQSPAEVSADISDSTSWKTLKWDSLNSFVSYHILKPGAKSKDTAILFLLEDLAHYGYLTHAWQYTRKQDPLDPVGQDSLIYEADQLKLFLLSDSFSDRRSLDCLLKVKSELFYHQNPDILKHISVRPKDPQQINALIDKLNKEKYAEQVVVRSSKRSTLDSLARDTTSLIYIQISLKPEYRDLDKIKIICEALKENKLVAHAFFNDLFTGLNGSDIILHLRSIEKAR